MTATHPPGLRPLLPPPPCPWENRSLVPKKLGTAAVQDACPKLSGLYAFCGACTEPSGTCRPQPWVAPEDIPQQTERGWKGGQKNRGLIEPRAVRLSKGFQPPSYSPARAPHPPPRGFAPQRGSSSHAQQSRSFRPTGNHASVSKWAEAAGRGGVGLSPGVPALASALRPTPADLWSEPAGCFLGFVQPPLHCLCGACIPEFSSTGGGAAGRRRCTEGGVCEHARVPGCVSEVCVQVQRWSAGAL